MSNSYLEFEDLELFSSVMDLSKCTDKSIQRDFNGDLSFEELIISAVSKLQNRSKLEGYLKSIEMRVKRKDDSTARALREMGNSYYGKKDLKMALVKYNESIKCSLHPSMEDISDKKQTISYQDLSFSYGNRSAVLFEMGLYDEACTDIRRAVSFGNSQQKLSVRYCKSLIHLKKNPQSPITSCVFDTVFGKTETDLGFSLDDEHKKLITEHKYDVNKAAKKKSQFPKYVEFPKYTEVLKPVPEHPRIPGLSNKVDVTTSDKRGRYLIAREDIYPGALLVTDPIFAATLVPKHVGEYCSACSNPCKVIFVPCHQCTSAVFCNEECRDEAFKSYHHYECSVLPLFGLLGLNYVPDLTLRIIVSSGYSKLHDYVKIFEKEEEANKPSMAKRGFSSEGIYDSNSYRTVYYLIDHKEKRDTKDLFKRSFMAVVMTFILKKYTSFFGEENISLEQSVNNVHFDECEMLIAKLILRHLMSIEVNATGNVLFYEESLGSWNEKNIGQNLQCLIALLSHSCNPNAVSQDSSTIRSMAFIAKGTEISISYRHTFVKGSKKERRAFLRQYFFTCDCIACVEDWQVDERVNIDAKYFIKCMFGCKNGTLNQYVQRCTKCSKVLKKDKSLYSETYLKHINGIIYGSSSENSNSIKRDMALTTENVFTELDTQINSFLLFQYNGQFSKPLMEIRQVAYIFFKGIYLFDTYGDCPNNYMLYAMRVFLKMFFYYSYYKRLT